MKKDIMKNFVTCFNERIDSDSIALLNAERVIQTGISFHCSMWSSLAFPIQILRKVGQLYTNFCFLVLQSRNIRQTF